MYSARRVLPESIRTANIKYLNEHGFYPAEWLPLPTLGRAGEEGFPGGILRPASEIATRLLCHAAVFAWGSAPPAFTDKIVRFIERNDLNANFTPTECEIVAMDKAEAFDKHSFSVGWRLENMWSLAWGLGITPEPLAVSGQITDDVSGILMEVFLPEFETLVGELVDSAEVADAEDVVRVHDVSQCRPSWAAG